jgi:hypothetical protein
MTIQNQKQANTSNCVSIYRLFFFLITVSVWLGLCSCSHSTQNSGGGIETETITAKVVNAENQFVSGALVYLYPASTPNPVAQDSAKSDTNGMVSFTVDASISWSLLAQTSSSLGYANTVTTTTNSIFIHPAKAKTVFFMDHNLIPRPVQISFWGYPGLYKSDSNGTLLLPKVPTQALWMHIESLTGDFADFDYYWDHSQTNDTILIEPNKLLVSDFSNGALQTLLGPVTGGGYWYQVDDGEDGGSSFVDPTDIGKPNSSAVQSTYGWQGAGLKAQFLIAPNGWGAIGFQWGTKSVNLQSMDSLVFKAKGQGQLKVEFVSKMISDRGDFNYPGVMVTLQEDWQTFVIDPDSLRINSKVLKAPEQNWAVQAKEILFTQFTATDSCELYLDELEIWGVTLVDLLQ